LGTSDNKNYLLRREHCVGSRARPYAPKDRGQSTSGTLVLCFAARRYGQILCCHEDATTQNLKVILTFSDIVVPLQSARILAGAINVGHPKPTKSMNMSKWFG